MTVPTLAALLCAAALQTAAAQGQPSTSTPAPATAPASATPATSADTTTPADTTAPATQPDSAAALVPTGPPDSAWRSLLPDTIGRLVVHVDTASSHWVRISVDTAEGKTPVITGALSADSVEAWAKALDAAASDSLSTTRPREYRLGEYAMMDRDSAASGPGFRLIVADTTGEHTFAVMIPFSYVPRITNAFARATRAPLPPIKAETEAGDTTKDK